MKCAFQDKKSLYLVMDLMPGGDLRYYFSKKKAITESETSISFYIPSIYILKGS